MCGIIFYYGKLSKDLLYDSLKKLTHRGPDETSIWNDDQAAVGFQRLVINEEGTLGQQPMFLGECISVVNGEIYNHKQLVKEFSLSIEGLCDAKVILPLFEKLGEDFLQVLDGFYSGIIYNPKQRILYSFRDFMGKKPLFVGMSKGSLFITSELKVLEEIEWFKILPKGLAQINLYSGKITVIATHKETNTEDNLYTAMEQAVQKRLPEPNQLVGVFLSGGLDSSIVASFVSKYRKDAIYYILGEGDSLDSSAVPAVIDQFELQNIRRVSLPSDSELPELIRRVVYATESYNPSIISNGLSTFLLAAAASRDGLKIVLTGEGADELFGGYHQFHETDPWRETRQQLISEMHFTELRRLDLSTMAHSIEARCPFLDKQVRCISNHLKYQDLYQDKQNKITLRKAFAAQLPSSIVGRRKTSFDVGSGIREKVVQFLRRNGKSEREELLDIWKELFPYDATETYFYEYPTFDKYIDIRGEYHQ